MPHLFHLRPPSSADRIWLNGSARFSLSVTGSTPRPDVATQLPVCLSRDIDLDRIAYFFDYELDGGLPDSAYAGMRRAAADWFGAWQADKPPVLKYWSAPHFIQIYDERRSKDRGEHTRSRTRSPISTWRAIVGPSPRLLSGENWACACRWKPCGRSLKNSPARPDVPRWRARSGVCLARSQDEVTRLGHLAVRPSLIDRLTVIRSVSSPPNTRSRSSRGLLPRVASAVTKGPSAVCRCHFPSAGSI